MAKKTSAKSSGTKVQLKCVFCQGEFESTLKKNMDDIICPYCGKSAAYILNEDGVPTGIVGEAVNELVLGGNGMPKNNAVLEEDVDIDAISAVTKKASAALLQEMAIDTFIERQRAALLKAKLEAEQYRRELERLYGGNSSSDGNDMNAPQNAVAQVQKIQAFFSALAMMDEESREKFLKQLEENPALAITLGWMLNPPNPQQFGFFNPFMMMLPMMQGEPQQTQQFDPVSLVTAIITAVKELKEMAQDNQPKTPAIDEALKEELRAIREELNSLRDRYYQLQIARIEAPQTEMENLLKRIEALERKIEEGGSPKKLVEQIKALREFYEETERLLGAPKKSEVEDIDAWIKKKKFEHELQLEKEKTELEKLKLQEKLEKKKLARALLQSAVIAALKPQTEAETKKEEKAEAKEDKSEAKEAKEENKETKEVKPKQTQRVVM